MEMLIGFVFMLFLSDSRTDWIHYFAADAKEIYILILALFFFIDRDKFTPANNLYTRFIPFFIVAIICIFNTPPENSSTAIQKTASYVLLLITIPGYVQRAYIEQGKNFFKALIYLGIAILFMGFIFKFINPEYVTREERFQGLFGNPNGLGIFSLLFFFFFTVILELEPKLFSRREKIIVYGLVVLSIYMSGSRGSLFGFLIYFLFSGFYRISPFLGSVVVIAFMSSYSYLSDHLVGIINSLGLGDYMRVNTLQEGSGRFIAWQFSWVHIQESYWFGRGFEYTEYLFNIPANVYYLQTLGHQGNAHNSYITLWLDTGLIGVVTYVLAFASCFFKAVKRTRLALPLMYASLFSSFFESWLTASLNPFTIMLFITLAIITSDVIYPPKAAAAIPVQ